MEAFLVLAGIAALPVAVSIVLPFRGHWVWIVAVAAGTALPLQLQGLTSTCTQGADGTFGTGAIFSAPFLLAAMGFTLWAPRGRWSGSVGAGIVTALVLLAMLLLTRDAWVSTWLHGTPCGQDLALYSSSAPMVVIILGGYLILPSLLLLCVVWMTFRAWKSRATS